MIEPNSKADKAFRNFDKVYSFLAANKYEIARQKGKTEDESIELGYKEILRVGGKVINSSSSV